MQHCPKCRIDIRGNKKCCPLCKGDLTGTPEPDVFPVIYSKIKRVSVVRILTFIAAALIVTMLVSFYMTGAGWPIVVIIMTVVGWIDILLVFYYRYNLIKMITIEVDAGLLICFFIDRHFSGLSWSLQWVIPFGILGLFITTLLIGILSKLRFEDGILYLIFDILCAFLQLIAVAKGVNTFPYPAVIITALLFIGLLALLLFRFRDVRNASGKWFNI